MLYSLLWHRTRFVPVESRWGSGPDEVHKYDREETAFAETQYFTSLKKAQGFAQQYATEPLVWELNDPYLSTTHKDIYFQIQKMEVDLDTREMPPLPSNFAELHSLGD